jgi:DNA-binding transcriptional LysR family regulator
MDLIYLMTVFIAVGEEECLAGAARRLDLSPAAVTRAVHALETRLNVPLLLRMTRKVRLTEAGWRHLETAKRITAALAAADQAAYGENVGCSGRLAITASVVFGKTFVLPCIADYMHQYPGLDVVASFVNRPVNLVDEGLDVAVRIGHLPDSGLKSLAVGKLRRVMCASPAYLARHGVPEWPADLVRHTFISRNGISPGPDVMASAARETGAASRLHARLTVTGSEAAIQAALAGLGIARVMLYQVAPLVADGSLEIVLADHEGPLLPVRVLHRQGRYGSSKVRNFVDLLVARLRAEKRLR